MLLSFKRKKNEMLLKKQEIDENVLDELTRELIELQYEVDKDDESFNKGRKLEKFLEKLFLVSGYQTELSTEKGVDLFVTKDKVTTAIEIKRRLGKKQRALVSDDVRIQNSRIREKENISKHGSKMKCAVIAMAYFTNDAMELAEREDIELIDKKDFYLLIAQLQPEILARTYYRIMPTSLERCKECGAEKYLKMKKENNEEFLGCSNYKKHKGGKTVKANRPKEKENHIGKRNSVSDNILYSELKDFRLKKSTEKHVPPYAIFYNETLDELVKKKPCTREELMAIKGIGEKKVLSYGDEILEIIKKY